MHNFFKKRKEKKEEKKRNKELEQSNNLNREESDELTNGEREAQGLTSHMANLSIPSNSGVRASSSNSSQNARTDALVTTSKMHLCMTQFPMGNRDIPIRRQAPPPPLPPARQAPVQPQTRQSDNITTAALNVLEAVGMTHESVQNTFYLARMVPKREPVHDYIKEYVKNGQLHGYGLKVTNIVRLVRDGCIEFQHTDKCQEHRLLLWHGTKHQTVVPILERGFALPARNGQMFGPGIYFADRVSKSANYCDSVRGAGTKAYLFLCDVLLGNVYNAKKPHTEFTEAPNGTTKNFNSVKCTGENIPDPSIFQTYHGSKIPLGPTVSNDRFPDYTVRYNEFIVYSTENIRIMFLVEVEFTDEPFLGEERVVNRDLAMRNYR